MKTLGTVHSSYTHVVACLRKGGGVIVFVIVFMPGARLENHEQSKLSQPQPLSKLIPTKSSHALTH